MILTPLAEVRKSQIPVGNALDKWVSKLWNHSLDDFTREHRAKARDRFNEAFNFITSYQFANPSDPAKFMAARIGGGDVWFARPELDNDPGSDNDLVVYCEDPEMGREFFNKYDQLSEVIRNLFKIDIVTGVQPLSNSNDILDLINSALALPLLITPDELIVGNLSIAQQGRLAIIEQLDRMSPEARNYYWRGDQYESFKNFFERFYRDWFYYADGYYVEIGREGEYKPNKRTQFEEHLMEQALKSSNPEYIEQFFQWLLKFELPDIALYSEVIKASGGRLKIA